MGFQNKKDWSSERSFIASEEGQNRTKYGHFSVFFALNAHGNASYAGVDSQQIFDGTLNL